MNLNGDLTTRISGEFGAFDLPNHLIALGAVGSLSHGTYVPDHIDDVDLMGIVVPPERHIIGLGNWEHWVYKKDEWDVVLYSAGKMVRLLLKANPNVLGFLWLPEYLVDSEHFQALRAARDAFSSKLAYQSFVGYAYSQLKKMQNLAYEGYMGQKRKELVDQFGYDTKNASHCIRLLRMGTEFLETGTLSVWREDREELLSIKKGAWSLDRVHREANMLLSRVSEARASSSLPEKPDYDTAERLLVDMHRSVL